MSAQQSPLMTVAEVARFTTYSRTQIFKLRAEGKFPRAVPLGEKRIAFVREEIEQWFDARLADRDAVQTEGSGGLG